MATEIAAARLLVYQAAWLADRSPAGDGVRFTRESSMAKLYASEVAVRVANEAVQVFGGYGFIKDYPGGEVLSRREALHDRRRHQRNPAPGDRAANSGQASCRRASVSAKPCMRDDIDNWAAQVRARRRSRARARHHRHRESAIRAPKSCSSSFFRTPATPIVIGVTGAPGHGQKHARRPAGGALSRAGPHRGIIAVDPTSPFTGGAILGDRIRMQGHAGDAGIFIRSMATRGFLGGLARATADVALLLDAAGKQIILIETVGVGQDEIDIVRLADCTLVVLVPGLGDDVQKHEGRPDGSRRYFRGE